MSSSKLIGSFDFFKYHKPVFIDGIPYFLEDGLYYRDPNSYPKGWWDEKLDYDTKPSLIYREEITLKNGEVLIVAVQLNPGDSQYFRTMIKTQYKDNPRAIFNLPQKELIKRGIYDAVKETTKNFLLFMSQNGLVFQERSEANNTHGVGPNREVLIGTGKRGDKYVDEPNVFHFHHLFRQIDGFKLFGKFKFVGKDPGSTVELRDKVKYTDKEYFRDLVKSLNQKVGGF